MNKISRYIYKLQVYLNFKHYIMILLLISAALRETPPQFDALRWQAQVSLMVWKRAATETAKLMTYETE